MSRARYTRRLPAAALVAGLALAVSACGGGSTDSAAAPAASASSAQLDPNMDLSKQSITISVWPGYTPEDLPKRVKDKLKTDLKVTLHDTNEIIMGKLTAGADTGLDVAFVSGQYAQASTRPACWSRSTPSSSPTWPTSTPRPRSSPTTRATSSPSPTPGAPPASATAATW